MDGAEEERDSRVERRRERPETGIARVRRGAGRRREERSVVVREKKEKGMKGLGGELGFSKTTRNNI